MKFITKINRNYIWLIAALFILTSVISYLVISNVLFQNAKENLIEKEFMLKNEIEKTDILPELYPLYETTKLKDSIFIKTKFKQIYLKGTIENELEPYTEYKTVIKLKNNFYLLKIRQSSVENEDLLLAIILPLLIMLFLVFSFSYFVNKRQITSVWQKFEYNLNEIEQISLQNPKNLNLASTNIKEFESLNSVINKLVKKLQADYNNLKEFTENASHELQTPLTVILMNLEEIMQNNLPKDVYKKVYQSYQEIKKLTKLNKNLLLLSKIDNQQFLEVETVDLSELVVQKLELFKSIIVSKNIVIKTEIKAAFKVNMSPFLANILINNLLYNAINHNILKGKIFITTNANFFEISNSTNIQNIDISNLFKRFYKNSTDNNSVGLGLAIVKRITDTYSLKLNVNKKENKLFFTLSK